MNIFTLALYVVLLALTFMMVKQLITQIRNDRAEKRRQDRLNYTRDSPFKPLHGQNRDNDRPGRWRR